MVVNKSSKLKQKRARNKKGQYLGDDKSTPNINEAYVTVKPKVKKSVAKKSVAKKSIVKENTVKKPTTLSDIILVVLVLGGLLFFAYYVGVAG
jgi:hypothetical protein|tara:strand:+ start:600 stop:878 length:279 start_codon:yes stop_codon:yes gene_type:complete